jgi:hypothetical protein
MNLTLPLALPEQSDLDVFRCVPTTGQTLYTALSQPNKCEGHTRNSKEDINVFQDRHTSHNLKLQTHEAGEAEEEGEQEKTEAEQEDEEKDERGA